MRVVLVLLCLGFAVVSGCVVGPRYAYTKQSDSALVDIRAIGDANSASIDKIDGLVAPTAWLALRWGGRADEVYIAPGSHTLSVTVNHHETMADGIDTDSMDFQGSATITVGLIANHHYHFDASHSGSQSLRLDLLDETTHEQVGQWYVHGVNLLTSGKI